VVAIGARPYRVTWCPAASTAAGTSTVCSPDLVSAQATPFTEEYARESCPNVALETHRRSGERCPNAKIPALRQATPSLPAAVRKRDRRCVAKKIWGAAIRGDVNLKGGGFTQSGRRLYKPARPLQTGCPSPRPSASRRIVNTTLLRTLTARGGSVSSSRMSCSA
jgi:hypothetical protein